jgi:hypothetical protein
MTAMKCVEGFTFGADPELFLVDDKGELVSAVGLIPGTKQEPHKVDKGAVQVDGLAAEFNIDPASSFDEWNGNIVTVLKQLKAMLPKGYGFRIEPAVRFSQSVMDAQPDTANALGCDPDFNAWTGEVNPYPDTAKDPLLRTAAGHVHIGWTGDELMPVTDELHVGHCRDLVKQLDWFLGAWSVQKDPDVTRRALYGKAGAFRPKPYGVEYRVLSNFWLVSKDLRRLVWNRLQSAVDHMADSEYPRSRSKYNPVIQSIINEGDKDSPLFGSMYFPLVAVG